MPTDLFVSPGRLFVERRLSEPAKCVNGFSVRGDCAGREQGTRRLAHEGHKLVRKAGHRAPDTNAANIGASANTSHPASLANIALDNRPPTAQFDDAPNISVLLGKLRLLVVATPITPFVHCLTKQPRRA